MKTNEAPEKLYLHPDLDSIFGMAERSCESEIEYTRTDVFIEKALKWYCLDCECNDNCKADHKCFFRQHYKRFLEGNDKALPPKFENAINPDGSTTENYRYRHFIRRMQDAFIEKAVSYLNSKLYDWVQTTNPNQRSYANTIMKQDFIDDLKQAMKDE